MTDQTTDTAVEAAPLEAPAAAQLQVQDIVGAAQCIQLASQRGAFQAGELSQVGGIYDRLVAFLQASGALTPATSEETADTEASAANEPAAE